ncbi:MAG: neutral zinc metallopeptidase [Mycobacteriales bacterium]
MRLRVDNPDASQVVDRRGMRSGAAVGGGLGVVGLIVAVLFNLLGGGDGGGAGFDINSQLNQIPGAQQGSPLPKTAAQEAETKEITLIVNHVQQSWKDQFTKAGKQYPVAKLVLFEDVVSTGCGQASSAVGPFYCPQDQQVYLDLGFFKDLQSKFGAPGDFAQAYVIAHEIGHHVQTVLGVEAEVRKKQQANRDQANEFSVRMELQADCFAGVWGHSAFAGEQLDPGDLEEALQAAEAIGDDRLQQQAGGRVNPESWTHGSSEQRNTWFRKGFDSGDPTACDTFSGDA